MSMATCYRSKNSTTRNCNRSSSTNTKNRIQPTTTTTTATTATATTTSTTPSATRTTATTTTTWTPRWSSWWCRWRLLSRPNTNHHHPHRNNNIYGTTLLRFRPVVTRLVCVCLMIVEATPWTNHHYNHHHHCHRCVSFARGSIGPTSSTSTSTTTLMHRAHLGGGGGKSFQPQSRSSVGSVALFDHKSKIPATASSSSTAAEEATETRKAMEAAVSRAAAVMVGEARISSETMGENSSSSVTTEQSSGGATTTVRGSNRKNDGDDDDDDHQQHNNNNSRVEILADDKEFEKPERDPRQYRLIQLKRNNLKVLLVSDQMDVGDVGVEAAAVHVQAGHFDDTIPGLAHFHEHMLFLGTRKYPQEDDYETFLNQHGGGSSNAYTDMEDTNYFFSITTENTNSNRTSAGLTGALDRFAQFFIQPKFDPDAVDRELQAIDSEYRNGKTSDSWRNYQALKSWANVDHAFAKFGCGNYDTLTALGTDHLLAELQKFWSTYYQSYNLRLAVVGHASLDALQQTVEETFGELPYSEGQPRYDRTRSILSPPPSPKTPASSSSTTTSSTTTTEEQQQPLCTTFVREHASGCKAFGPEQLGVMRFIIPLLETRSVKIHFAVPPLQDPTLRDCKPYRVISHLLGHESPGSLHALLNAQGFITSLSSSMGIDTSDFCLFSLNLNLTPEGMNHLQEVLDFCFQWIAVLRRNQHKLQPYHEEMMRISDLQFRFRENGDPTDFVSNAADYLFDSENAQHFLKGSTILQSTLDPMVTQAFLNRFTPDNCLIVVTNADLKHQLETTTTSTTNSNNNLTMMNIGGGGDWTVEPWYGAPHTHKTIDVEQRKQWESPPTIDPRLHFPELNAYIPNDFSLRCDEEKDEVVALDDEKTKDPVGHGPNEEEDDDDDDTDETSIPPVVIMENDRMRLWHKMDKYWRVPKAFIRLSILSPDVYRSPRSITYNRIFQRILNDDLNSFVYDASLAGCNYRVSCVPTAYRISVRGYSQKLSFLLDTLTCRIFSLIAEMKAAGGGGGSSESAAALQEKFNRARDGLCRETKNYRLDAPYEIANYNSRLLMEENVWYIDNYINEMEGLAGAPPLSMEECAHVAQECLSDRIKCEVLCMGNLATREAHDIGALITQRFLTSSRVLSSVETPTFRSVMLPTKTEADRIFGTPPTTTQPRRSIPLIYADLALSETEENNAAEVILQIGSELEMGYEGLATFDLLTHIAYNSAFNQLRTIEQLGYIVSVSARKTAGNVWAMSILVQGSAVGPKVLEERIEAWLQSFGQELKAMTPDAVAAEGQAVVTQLLEKETKLSQEVSRVWGEILNTEGMTETMRTPAFDRLERLAKELVVEEEEEAATSEQETVKPSSPRVMGQILKNRLLAFFDQKLCVDSPHRRAMSARIYNHKNKDEYMKIRSTPGVVNSFSDLRHLKQFLPSWPTVPYWRIDNSTVTNPLIITPTEGNDTDVYTTIKKNGGPPLT